MLHSVVEFCAAVLYVIMYSCMLCTVVTCYLEVLHAVQCCYMSHCVVEFSAVVLNVVMCSCLLCSIFTCCIVLLNFMQQCYIL